MKTPGIKIHETKRNSHVSFILSVICIFIGFQYIGAAETRQTAATALVLGIVLLSAAVYMFFTPMIILGEDAVFFRSGNAAKKEVSYSEIASWSMQNDKYLVLQLKGDKDENGGINTITINYRNISANNRITLTDHFKKKGIKQVFSATASASKTT